MNQAFKRTVYQIVKNALGQSLIEGKLKQWSVSLPIFQDLYFARRNEDKSLLEFVSIPQATSELNTILEGLGNDSSLTIDDTTYRIGFGNKFIRFQELMN
ncbi:MAG TPA: hypothetical protein VJ917_06085 [Saprospiraceae bacterium]|nr:hypothetical protein [Saprospiraceae bacterium]